MALIRWKGFDEQERLRKMIANLKQKLLFKK